MFKTGDLVVFKNNDENQKLLLERNCDIKIGFIYKVVGLREVGETRPGASRILYIDVNGNVEHWYDYRFDKVTREEKLKRILK